MPDETPKILTFEPPLNIFFAQAGEVVSVTGDGEWEHQGNLKVTSIANLGELVEFIQAINAGHVRCCLKLDGQVVFIEPWLACHLESLHKQGRVQLVDVPEPGESGSVTEVDRG